MNGLVKGSWKIFQGKTGINLSSGGITWGEAQTEIELADGSVWKPEGLVLEDNAFAWEYRGGLRVVHALSSEDGWLRVATRVSNRTGGPLALRRINVLAGQVDGPWQKIFAHSYTMTGHIGIFDCGGSFESDSCVGWTDRAGTRALAAGFERLDEAFYRFAVEANRVAPGCLREDVLLADEQDLEISPLLIGEGASLSGLLDRYARRAGRVLSARADSPVMTGWCSWYHYYGHESAGDILENARTLAGSPLAGKLRLIQIDDGWNLPSPGQARVWGDWFPGDKFPQGMKTVADELHGLGFMAGLWLAPFSVDKGSHLAAEHQDWIVRMKNPETGLLDPAGPGHVFGLDLTHPEVLAWLRETFLRVFHEWGFDYIKIDFLIHGVLPGIRHDPAKTTAQAFRQGMRVIRECAGEKFILNCGSPLGPSIGLCDAMRIGPDVGGCWYAPMNLDQWPHGNCSIRAAAYPTLFRQWMHRIWWQNDPDCLIVRDGAVSHEVEAMTKVKERMKAEKMRVEESDFGLSRDEAEFWVRAIWFTGGMDIVSEVWSDLSPERQELLGRAFPPHGHAVRWVDYYEYSDVCVMQTMDGPPMVGLFNLSDESRQIVLPRERLRDASPQWSEWLTGERVVLEGAQTCFPMLAPRAARIWKAAG